MHVAEVQRPLLPRRSNQRAFGHTLVVIAAKAVAAHVGQVGVTQDHEGPRAHRGAGLEAFLRGPGLEQRFLDEVVSHVGPPA